MTTKAREGRVIHMFADDHMAPSEIDEALGMVPGTSRRMVVAWWVETAMIEEAEQEMFKSRRKNDEEVEQEEDGTEA